ncbi:urease accessory transmembrane protein [Advenella kashmirensis WT001]|uniref:Urease accessory transmembrane protein n=1 Tax=Advenella kashmirensis (strain DSM 17095 / LMG 22695 / WT001) TaxID=1036672 RepID=I3UAE8_ADVKW|nr:urease accessory transmembrane protein [Advenella kashmirensis WT001]
MRTLLKPMNVAITIGTLLGLTATAVFAHPGHIDQAQHSMFAAGLLHPLTGLDHLLAMLAVGLWSALTHQSLRRAMLAPVVFLIMLFAGAMLGIMGVQLPLVEPMIMASLLILGLLVATRKSINEMVGFVIVGAFACFTGWRTVWKCPRAMLPYRLSPVLCWQHLDCIWQGSWEECNSNIIAHGSHAC